MNSKLIAIRNYKSGDCWDKLDFLANVKTKSGAYLVDITQKVYSEIHKKNQLVLAKQQ